MNREQEKRIVDYYSTTDKYIRSELHSDAHQAVFTKENDKYQWIVLEHKRQNDIEVRRTDSHGKITAWDSYELVGNIPKCVSMERIQEELNIHIHFNVDEINLIYQFIEQNKAEVCAVMPKIISQTKDNDEKQTASVALKKLNSLSDESRAELIATIKRRKTIECSNSVRKKLAEAKKQLNEPTVTAKKKHRTENGRKAGMEL